MFILGNDGVYRSSLLDALSFSEHGFGSRCSDEWPGGYFQIRQIHSTRVVSTDEDPEGETADAVISGKPGQWVGIRTADCVPILLADPKHRTVAAVHAGWRGTAGGIAGAAVRKLVDSCGTNPTELVAAIGPAIGRCCYEVGAEVAGEFFDQFPEAETLRSIDLAEANRRQLLTVGLKREGIDVSGLCTRCESGEFYSWRREGQTAGRMVSAIRLRK